MIVVEVNEIAVMMVGVGCVDTIKSDIVGTKKTSSFFEKHPLWVCAPTLIEGRIRLDDGFD